jgi:hypothetical protein
MQSAINLVLDLAGCAWLVALAAGAIALCKPPEPRRKRK